jgi:hypothetical protein
MAQSRSKKVNPKATAKKAAPKKPAPKKPAAKRSRTTAAVTLRVQLAKQADHEGDPNPRAEVWLEYPRADGRRSRVILGAVEQLGPLTWKADMPQAILGMNSAQGATEIMVKEQRETIGAALVAALARVGLEVVP